MANNITKLDEDLKQRQEAEAAVYAENFNRDTELTDEDRAKLEALEKEVQTVVTEEMADGTKVSTPIGEFAAPLDNRVAEIAGMADSANAMIKTVNSGDIKKTVDDAKREARDQALRAFRELSVGDQEMTDDDIISINDSGLAAIQGFMKSDRIESDEIIKRLSKMNLQQIVDILPKEFVDIYVTPNELEVNPNGLMATKAKERLITTIAYLATTGPELDYLNEYIDNEHRLMAVSQQLMKCQMDFIDLLKDPKHISQIAEEAAQIEPDDNTVWSKYIRDPKHVHNEFAQKAIIYTKYKEAYMALLEEHKDHPDSCKIIQEQIDESDTKYGVYTNVLHLELMKELWAIMVERFTGDKRSTYKNLLREGVAALDRIRRSKQDVPFPVYDAALAKRPEELFDLYMQQFSNMVKQYNSAVLKVRQADPEKTAETSIEMIMLDGKFEDTTIRYFTLLLLILYGRIMKKLTSNTMTKYDSIMLDAYFQCYCKMGTDVYLMTDVWNIMKDFVGYAIDTWPATGKK